MKTRADFIRWLKPGRVLVMTRNDWKPVVFPGETPKPSIIGVPAVVEKVQTTSFAVRREGRENLSWCDIHKAAHMKYDGQTLIVCLNCDGTFDKQMHYLLFDDQQAYNLHLDQPVEITRVS
jgi:hypothetical protein